MSIKTDFDVLDPQQREQERLNVYRVEAAALRLDRAIALPDERVVSLASSIVGVPVRLLRSPRLGLAGHLIARWHPGSDGTLVPFILAEPGYLLSRTEVLHEAAHLLSDADGAVRGHGHAWRSVFVGLLSPSEARRVTGGFDFYGLSYHQNMNSGDAVPEAQPGTPGASEAGTSSGV